MNIDRLDLIAYGHLTDVSIDLSAGPNRFHVIAGRNESGKSTSMRAIDAWLYGFPGQTSDDYVHTMRKLRVGGIVRDGDATLHCIRRKGNRDTLLDGADAVTALDDESLQAMLGGVDKNTFGTQFLINHDELVAGGQLILQGEGELGETLFAAGAGLGRLKKIQDELKSAEDGLLKKQGKSKITDALKEVKQLRSDLKEAQVPPAEYGQLQKDVADKQAELQNLKTQSDLLSVERSSVMAKIEALPIIPDWQQATEEFAIVADAPNLPEDFPERRRNLAASITITKTNIDRLTKKRQQLSDELEQIGLDSKLLNNRDEIETLTKHLPVREKAEIDRTGFMLDVLNGQERDLRSLLADLAKTSQTNLPTIDADLGEQVRQFQLNETERNKVGRLAAEYATLVANVDNAQGQVERSKKQIETTSAELEKLPSGEDTANVAQALREIESPTSLATSINEATIARDRQRARCQTTQAKLGANQPLADLIALQLPDPMLVRKTAARIDQCEDEVQIGERQLGELRSQLADIEADFEALDIDAHLPSQADLQEARKDRDARLAKMANRATVTTETHDVLGIDSEDPSGEVDFNVAMQSVRQADEIVDQLRVYQNEVAKRETMAVDIRRTTTKIGEAQQHVMDHELNLNEAKQDWQNLWSPLGLTPRSPDAMKDWRDNHEKLCEQAETLNDLETKVSQCDQAIDLAIKQLSRVIDRADGTESDPIETLMQLHDQAKTLVDQQEIIQRDRDSLQQKMAMLDSDFSAAETTLADRIKLVDAWQKQWDQATQSLSSASPAPEDVLPMLDAIKDLSSIKKDRDDMLHRRTSIENETIAFLTSASRLLVGIQDEASALRVAGDDSSLLLQQAVPKLQILSEQAKQATTDAATRERLANEIQQLDQELQSETVSQERDTLHVNELCREADCQDLDKLPEIEARARRRQIAYGQIRSAELNLKRLASGQSVEEFIGSIGNTQEGVLEDQLDDVQQRRKQLADRIETVQRELGALDQQVRQIDGGETASDIAQSLASQWGEIRSDAEEYMRLRLARGILRRAIEYYRSENQEPVLKIAEEYFRELTSGNYVGLKVDFDDKDKPVLYGVRDGRDDVPASRMSKGTADSLYLALRLASLRHRCEDGKPMPLIVDDCLQQLDDDRAAAAMNVFSRLSTQTQVIMFTHHEHLVGLAEKHLSDAQVHIHRLAMS